jgi:hypothetical protein
MNLDRKPEESFGATVGGFGCRPRSQYEDGVGLEAANAQDRRGKIAVENRAPFFDGRGGDDGREKAAADDVDAERPRLVAVDEGADVRAGTDQEDALRRQ